MKTIKNIILSDSKELFNELLNNINRDYFYKLEKIQTKENQKYGTNINIINHDETKVNDKLTSIYENEILKYSLCIISQIFCEKLNYIFHKKIVWLIIIIILLMILMKTK